MRLYLCGDGNGSWYQGISPTGRVRMCEDFSDAKLFKEEDRGDLEELMDSLDLHLYYLGYAGPVACTAVGESGSGFKLYVYGDGCGNYYRGRDADGRVKDVDNIAEACFFNEVTKDLATDCIELGYSLYSVECGAPVLEQNQVRAVKGRKVGSVQQMNLGSVPASMEGTLDVLKQQLIEVLERIDKIAPVQFLDWESEYVYNFLKLMEDRSEGRVYVCISGVNDNLPAHRANPLRDSRGGLLLPSD